jgi:glycosyltransferase involved in cell wall biosynthesis
LPIINEIYQIWLFRKLSKKFKQIEVINFDFTSYLIHKYFKKVYYYCNDNFSEISKKINNYLIYKYHVFCENKLASHSSICIGTSTVIVSGLKKFNKNTHLLLLGGPNVDDSSIIPNIEISKKSLLNIGLVGFIRNYNLSYQLLNNVLNNLNCNVTLIGPIEDGFLKRILYQDRIQIKGVLTGDELLEEINKFDVAIAPYIDSKLNEGAFPNKLLVYLSMGKPVVVSDLRSLKEICIPDKLIYLAKKNEDFPEMILKAHEENSIDLISKRIEYSKINSWDNRIKKFLDLIKN